MVVGIFTSHRSLRRLYRSAIQPRLALLLSFYIQQMSRHSLLCALAAVLLLPLAAAASPAATVSVRVFSMAQ